MLRIFTAIICVSAVSTAYGADVETCLNNESVVDSSWATEFSVDCGDDCQLTALKTLSRSCSTWDGDCDLNPNTDRVDLKVPYGDGPRCLERAPWCLPLDHHRLAGQFALELPTLVRILDPRPASGTLPGPGEPSCEPRPRTRSERPPVPPPRTL